MTFYREKIIITYVINGSTRIFVIKATSKTYYEYILYQHRSAHYFLILLIYVQQRKKRIREIMKQ